jgi:hypothetical protein
MKNSIKSLLLFFCVFLSSCYGTDDDTNLGCNGNCNVFTGRIYTENNIGIPNVEVSLTYELNQIGAAYKRIIAKTNTDANGNYRIEAFIKDNEFNVGYFFVRVDEKKIENSLTNEFFKPSELVPNSNEYFVQNLTNRTQVINMNYKIPLKTTLTVNLNNFNPITKNDSFIVRNLIEYGFETDYNKFFTKSSNDGYANGINSTIIIPSVFGENELKIFKVKNNIVENINQIIRVNNPNTTNTLSYDY